MGSRFLRTEKGVMSMKRFTARLYLTLLIVLATPVVCFAADVDGGDTIFEWVVRFFAWAAGGWHSL